MNNDPNLIGNTRVVETPQDMVHRDVYEYILHIAEVTGILPNGTHKLPDVYEDVIDAILKIRTGEGLDVVHGGFFRYSADADIQSHNLAANAHENLKLDAGEVQQINNELVSVVEEPEEELIDGEFIGDDEALTIHNENQYAHTDLIADGAIIDGVVIMPETTIDEHNDDTRAHGPMILDGNIDIEDNPN